MNNGFYFADEIYFADGFYFEDKRGRTSRPEGAFALGFDGISMRLKVPNAYPQEPKPIYKLRNAVLRTDDFRQTLFRRIWEWQRKPLARPIVIRIVC